MPPILSFRGAPATSTSTATRKPGSTGCGTRPTIPTGATTLEHIHSDTYNNIVYDPDGERYVMTLRPKHIYRVGQEKMINLGMSRRVARLVSDELCTGWSGQPQTLLIPDETDAEREPIEGFDHVDCVPFRGDDTDHAVRWKSRSPDELAGRVVRLEFYLRDAHLYSFRAASGKIPDGRIDPGNPETATPPPVDRAAVSEPPAGGEEVLRLGFDEVRIVRDERP